MTGERAHAIIGTTETHDIDGAGYSMSAASQKTIVDAAGTSPNCWRCLITEFEIENSEVDVTAFFDCTPDEICVLGNRFCIPCNFVLQ